MLIFTLGGFNGPGVWRGAWGIMHISTDLLALLHASLSEVSP
jgi:hypothetical protein